MMRREGWNFPGEDYPPPESVTIAGKEVRAGDRVRLDPGPRRRYRVREEKPASRLTQRP